MKEIVELNEELQRKKRMLDNLKKNYERRKRLNLLDGAYESEIKSEIKTIENEIAVIQRRIRSIESESIRSKYINNK
jgi:hypothetical protein